eukprot:1936613-Amphidinium_carterae.1
MVDELNYKMSSMTTTCTSCLEELLAILRHPAPPFGSTTLRILSLASQLQCFAPGEPVLA